ncbi:MAG: ABC transporter ATP-binding protein [Chitinivibrionales bacterium]|nr:ABC transporter ATP-binding protein [Chitinivibrionales bacterium]
MIDISKNVQFENTKLSDIVELTNISQTYDGGKSYVIKDLNLLIEDKPDQGQFIVILGTSGCGKSTLLRYICGLQRPTSGTVLIRGKPRDDTMAIGMVFQRYSSFPWLSVLDNVALGLQYKGIDVKQSREKAMQMIQLVGLDGHQKKYAQYPTLSGGQLQRVAIARSLVSDPQILLMDEPFGALDVNTRLKMQDLVCEIWMKLQTTIIFVTHDISEAVYLADEIHMMRSNPAIIVQRILVNLSKERNRYIKRTKEFTELVHFVEDKMVEIELQLFEEQKAGKQ